MGEVGIRGETVGIGKGFLGGQRVPIAASDNGSVGSNQGAFSGRQRQIGLTEKEKKRRRDLAIREGQTETVNVTSPTQQAVRTFGLNSR